MDIPEFLDSGGKSWTLDSRLWTLCTGSWTLDSTFWMLSSGHWTLSSIVSEQNQTPVYDST